MTHQKQLRRQIKIWASQLFWTPAMLADACKARCDRTWSRLSVRNVSDLYETMRRKVGA